MRVKNKTIDRMAICAIAMSISTVAVFLSVATYEITSFMG